jgi:ankyrin repeat protein
MSFWKELLGLGNRPAKEPRRELDQPPPPAQAKKPTEAGAPPDASLESIKQNASSLVREQVEEIAKIAAATRRGQYSPPNSGRASENYDTLPIHNAARRGNLMRVKKLIEEDPTLIHRRDEDGTPLHHAAVGGHTKVAEYLLANGADVNAKGGMVGWTPLKIAVQWMEGKEVAELLRKHGGHL